MKWLIWFQLQDRMTDLATKLQNEHDARTLQESLYREQVRGDFTRKCACPWGLAG